MGTGTAKPRLLEGFRVLELGHFVAAPFCTRLLADLGADVIKAEPLGGDPVRQWGAAVAGHSLWWSMHGRNKRCITLNLKTQRGREIACEIAANCDVVVENFRPGHMERLGLGPETLRARNPGLIIARISGFGQEGPYRDRAAFGLIGEAMGGLRHLTNHPPGTTDLPPVRVGVSIGDSIAGLYAAFGIMGAAWARDRKPDGPGATLDIALSESVLSMMEGMLPEYGELGKIKQPTGGAIATAAPTNAYPTADGAWLLIGANSDPLFARLCAAMEMSGLAQDKRFCDNRSRVANMAELDNIISAWTKERDLATLASILEAADIPSIKAYTAKDCATDPQFLFRDMARWVDDPLFGHPILQAGVVPRVEGMDDSVRWPGPEVGAHNVEVLGTLLGMSTEQVSALAAEGTI